MVVEIANKSKTKLFKRDENVAIKELNGLRMFKTSVVTNCEHKKICILNDLEFVSRYTQ